MPYKASLCVCVCHDIMDVVRYVCAIYCFYMKRMLFGHNSGLSGSGVLL